MGLIKEEHRNLWIKLRAELIVHFHNECNKYKLLGSYSTNFAIRSAEYELNQCEKNGMLIITLEEMLIETPDNCLIIIQERKKQMWSKILNTALTNE